MRFPKPDEILHIEGPSSKTIFWGLLTWLFPLDRMEELQKELDDYWGHYRGLSDERAVVLVGALCVEDSLDRMINAFFPGSRILHENRDFTFSLKMDLLQACRLIPSRILDHCNLVRKLRNDFAHRLEFKTLSDWGSQNFQAVDQAIRSYLPQYDLGISHRKRFEDVVAAVCVALRMYSAQVEVLREFLDSPEFWKWLKQFKEKGAIRTGP